MSKIDGHINDYSDEQIIDVFKLKELESYFVAWIDKDGLNRYMSALDASDRVWHFSKRDFWKCPLSCTNAPKDLVEYLYNK